MTPPTAAYDLAMCDTCLGGSSVARRLSLTTAGLRALYLADFAVNPLGTRTRREIDRAVQRWLELMARYTTTAVIACNTASVCLHHSPHELDTHRGRGLRVVTMYDLFDRAIAATEPLSGARVCLIGTTFTVRQALYRERLLRSGARHVQALAAPHTESVIAHFRHASQDGRLAIVEEIGHSVRCSDVVVLACTCFPQVTDLIYALNPSCTVIDPAAGLDHLSWPGRAGAANRLTVAVSGGNEIANEVRRHVRQLFAGWQVEDVVVWQGNQTIP